MSQFSNALSSFFAPLTLAQRVLFGILSVIVVAGMITVFVWSTQTDYALLFGSLNPNSAQSIVEDLKKQGVPYKLTEGGASIMVPRDQVYDLRLQFASLGVADGAYNGYELFDNNTLGMTDFMQKVNLKRALEGELSRTITNLEQVDFARVHLVLPERSPFVDTKVDASASVIVRLRPGARLSQGQIEGISSLVAGSVQELMIENVTILDDRGNKISENEALAGDLALSNAQLRVKQQAESYLASKGQSMMDQVLGPGNSIIRVSTDHDFEKLTRDSEIIDPESRIVISEEQRSEVANDIAKEALPYEPNDPPALRGQTIDKGASSQEANVKVRNYEVSTKRELYEKPVGTITRMSVSVMLNYKKNTIRRPEGPDSIAYIPYSNAEIRELGEVVSAALGINPSRGDALNITQIRFGNDLSQDLQQQEIYYQQNIRTNDWIQWVLLLGGLIGAVFILYQLIKRTSPQLLQEPVPQMIEGSQQKSLPDGGSSEDFMGEDPEDDFIDLEGESDVYQRKLSPEAQRRLKLKSKMFDEIKNFAEFKTDDAANLVRGMLVNDDNS